MYNVKHCYFDSSRNYNVECSDISEARREMNRHTATDCASGLSLLYSGQSPIDCRKWSSPGLSATVIFHVTGTITVQLANAGMVWAHTYEGTAEMESVRQAAGDVHAALWSCDFGQYNGHEPEAEVLRPTLAEIGAGEYRVQRFSSFTDFEDFCLADHSQSWANVEAFCQYVERGAL
jgi:hypothetical protein